VEHQAISGLQLPAENAVFACADSIYAAAFVIGVYLSASTGGGGDGGGGGGGKLFAALGFDIGEER
jgi:hypothetical protein